MRNGFARELWTAGENVRYDAQCKMVLRHRIILAWILKYTAEEFEQFTLEEICDFIEGTPEVSASAVAPGETNKRRLPGMDGTALITGISSISGISPIIGRANEDKVPDEGSIYFDIRFYTSVPSVNGKVRIILNVEAQQSFYPGYEIVTRGIFYASRMISAQYGTEFDSLNYDGIKKVYSIWLCMNAPQYIGNAISVYHFKKEELEKGIPDKKQAYDKIAVCVVALNDRKSSENPLLKMLNVLLSPELPYEEKERILEGEFKIPMKEELGEEMMQMCNLSEYVYKKGMERGLEQGMERGMERGLEQGIESGIKNMLKENFADEIILKIFPVTREKLEEIRGS